MSESGNTFDWKDFMRPYTQAVEELDLKFNSIIKQFFSSGEYSPIHHVYSRVKSISSIMEKARKLGIEQEQIHIRITDIAGVRIITQFEEDIYQVVKLIKQRADMSVVTVKDYITTPKPSGYKSIHLIIEYSVNTIKGPVSYTHLDVVVAEEMKLLLRSLKEERIIILSTHIMDLALDLCDDIVLLNHGILEAVDKNNPVSYTHLHLVQMLLYAPALA